MGYFFSKQYPIKKRQNIFYVFKFFLKEERKKNVTKQPQTSTILPPLATSNPKTGHRLSPTT